MSAVGKVVRGRSRAVRCDGCGRISSDRESGYYVDASGEGRNITSKGRDCGHDFCDQCEENNPDPPACPKCEQSIDLLEQQL